MADLTVYRVPAGRRLEGVVRVPPSKSVSNRVLNLALLGRRPLKVIAPLLSDDIEAFAGALEVTGLRVERQGGDLVLTPGGSPTGGDIWCGASGTMARFVTASLAVLPGRWRVDGTPRLRQRPLGPLIEALRRLGASITCEGAEGHLPIVIEGRELDGGRVVVDAGDSSQFVSALAMAATCARSPVTLEVERAVSTPYVDLTLDALDEFGVRVERGAAGSLTVRPGLRVPERCEVEADFSSACYFAAGAALTGGRVELTGVRERSRQGDRRFFDLLVRMGAEIDWPAPDRAVVRAGGRLRAVDEDLSETPDQVPTLAAIAPFAEGVTRIRNVAHLRIKESDRLAASATELGRLGAPVEEVSDGLVVPGIWASAEPPDEPVEVDSHDDHRIAMSLALAGLKRPGLGIREPGVVAKSYPGFWQDLESCLTS